MSEEEIVQECARELARCVSNLRLLAPEDVAAMWSHLSIHPLGPQCRRGFQSTCSVARILNQTPLTPWEKRVYDLLRAYESYRDEDLSREFEAAPLLVLGQAMSAGLPALGV